MIHTLRYDLDERMNRMAVAQYFWAVHARRKIPASLIVLLYALVVVLIEPPYKDLILVAVAVSQAVVVTVWIKAYFAAQSQARDGLKLLSHPTITLTLTDDAVEYASSTGTRRFEWSKIDRFGETKDFFVFHAGRIPLLVVPKKAFATEPSAFVREKMRLAIKLG